MKKAILATLVSAIAVSGAANAATAEVYGSVGVNYDTQKFGDTDRVDGINAARGTDFGIRGEAATTGALTVSYDMRAEFDDEERLEMSRANVTIGTEMADLTVGKAESVFHNSTRAFDKFDGHFTGDFERFDSVDAVERAVLTVRPVAGLTLGMDVAGSEKDGSEFGDALAFAAQYEIAGVTLAGAFERNDVEDEEDTRAYRLGAGYDFSAVGVDGLTVGAAFEELKDRTEDSRDRMFAITGAYEMTSDLTLIAGFSTEKGDEDYADRSNITRVAVDYAITDAVVATAGYAHISHDETGRDSDSMGTVGIAYNF
ncbi:putative Porin_4 domain-containing protein [Vibrio chagasii]|nr:putative Porin_4 domain-containing protein [Vibrio chagasii]